MSVHTGARLDYMRNVFRLGLLVEILHRFAAELLVLRGPVAARRDAFELLRAEREVD
jgi:hypothetical protein